MSQMGQYSTVLLGFNLHLVSCRSMSPAREQGPRPQNWQDGPSFSTFPDFFLDDVEEQVFLLLLFAACALGAAIFRFTTAVEALEMVDPDETESTLRERFEGR